MIDIAKFGKHVNVLWAQFGTGDISFTKAALDHEEHQSILMFHNNPSPKKIGGTSNEWDGKSSNDLPKPEFVLAFSKKESIEAVIHSLQEIADQWPSSDITP